MSAQEKLMLKFSLRKKRAKNWSDMKALFTKTPYELTFVVPRQKQRDGGFAPILKTKAGTKKRRQQLFLGK